jgi:hypothetical protein
MALCQQAMIVAIFQSRCPYQNKSIPANFRLLSADFSSAYWQWA